MTDKEFRLRILIPIVLAILGLYLLCLFFYREGEKKGYQNGARDMYNGNVVFYTDTTFFKSNL